MGKINGQKDHKWGSFTKTAWEENYLGHSNEEKGELVRPILWEEIDGCQMPSQEKLKDPEDSEEEK